MEHHQQRHLPAATDHLRWDPTTRKETLVFTLTADKWLEAGFSASINALRFSWAQVDRHAADILRATLKYR